MGKVTALRTRIGRGKRVSVFLDDRLAFSLETEVAEKEGLKVGQTLSEAQIEALAKANHLQRCLNAAVRLLGYRPRSESELRERLSRQGFDDDTQGKVLIKLTGQGLVDDTAFTRFWRENRESFRPRSRRMTRLELKRKGVADEIITQVVGTIDDEDSAYRAALKKARSLKRSDYESFRRRLGEYLRRRGFSYGVISHTVEKIWQDQESSEIELESVSHQTSPPLPE